MRRFAFILCCVVLAISASAELRQSDVLLTDAGVFYRVDTVGTAAYNEAHPDSPVESSSLSILTLTIISGDESMTVPVPGSFSGMVNLEPSLGYDPRDERVYVFWQNKPAPSASELLLTSYKDGQWTATTTFDNGIWRMRFNLRIGFTHFASRVDEEGTVVKEPATVAHAVWWEQYGLHEAARYAMLDLRDGEVTGITIRDMSELSTLSEPPPVREIPEDFDKSSFRTPFILDAPGGESVDILFANWTTHHYEIINVRPVLDEKNGVLHIPIGVTSGVMDAPVIRVRDVDVGLTAISSATTGSSRDLLIFARDEETIEYVLYRNGAWSNSRRVVLGERLSYVDALAALRRNLERH